MSRHKRKHPHAFTYWTKGALDIHNQPTWSGPFKSYCRWEDQQRLFLTENGREVRGQSVIYVPEDILKHGDYAAKGHFDDESPVTDSYEVKRPRKISNLRGTKTEYRFTL